MPTLPQNPFENLFGGEGAKATKETIPVNTKKNIPANPFEGLFEAKAQPPVQQRELDQFGLPKSYISAAPAGTTFKEPEAKESFWTKAAKAVLPKKLEDFFGLNQSATYKEITKKYEEAYAYEDLQRLNKKIEEGGGKLPKQTAGGVLQETKPEKYLPFVSAIPDIVNVWNVYQSAKRLERGENTIIDDYRLAKYQAEAQRDKTFGAKVASVLTELPSFGGELLLTGGIYTAGKEAVEKGVMKTAQKAVGETAGRIITKTLANVAGATLQVIPARIGEITEGTIVNMTPGYSYQPDEKGKFTAFINEEQKGENLWKAAAMSLGDQWVEVVSEHSGGIFSEMAAPVKSKLMKLALFNAFLKSNPTAGSAGFMKWVKQAGWNGTFAEIGEERIGELMRGGLTVIGLSKDGYKLPSKEQLAVELVSFAVPGVMIGVQNKMLESAGQGGTFQPAPTETEAPKPISEAENIIGARDLLVVGRGGTDLDAGTMTGLRQVIENYHAIVAAPVIEILNTDKSTLASIKVVPYPDGKWGYSFEINTAENGVSSDFLSNKFLATRPAAVEAAKQSLLDYAKTEVDNVSAQSQDDFEQIINQVSRVNANLEVPVEVRRGEAAPITGEAPAEVKTFREELAKEELDKIKANGFEDNLSEDQKYITLYHKTTPLAASNIERNGSFKAGSFFAGSEEAATALASTNKKGGAKVLAVRVALDSVSLNEGTSEFEADGQLKRGADGIYRVSDAYVKSAYADRFAPAEGEKTQKEKVAETVKEKPKTIKEIAEATKILEPNVRRILGVGAKEGTFERVDKGVYILKKGDKQLAYIETGDAIEVLPRMAKEGMKADMIFLDIPYKTPAVIGGNRGIKYEYITPAQFKVVVDAVKEIARYDETPVFYMFSQAKSGEAAMQKYTDTMTDAGFKPVARGDYTKLQLDGVTRVRNMRGNIIEPEGIILFTKSGVTNLVNPDLNFKLVRPKGYQTEKPAEMIKALIEMSTEEGEVVLDPFAGSGVVPAEAVKAGREAVAIEKSEKAVEEFIKPRVEKAAAGKEVNMSLDLTSKILALREKAITETKTEAPARKRGQLRPAETSFDRERKTLNRAFSKEIYAAYKSKYGEYPIGFISLSDSPFDWAHEPAGSIAFDVAQAETDQVETLVASDLADILDTLHALTPRGRSSEIIQSDIQYDVEGTRPAEKPKEAPKPRFARPKTEIKIGNKVVTAHEIAGKLIAKRPPLPILSEFQVKDGQLTATDLEVALRLNSDLPDGQYKLIGKDAVKTDTNPDDFPIVPEVEGKTEFTALTETIAQTLKAATLSTSDAGVRPELQGVYMKSEKGQITVASTDGYRLLIKQMRGKVAGEAEFILSNPEKVQKIIQALGGKVDVVVGKEAVKFTGENGEVYARRIDGTFPAFQQIIPAFKQRYTFDKKQLVAALKELKPYFKQIGYGASVQLNYKDGKVSLLVEKKSADHPSENVRKEVVLNVDKAAVDIAERSINDGVVVMPIKGETDAAMQFNPDYLIDALATIEDDSAYLYTPENPGNMPSFVSGERELRSEEAPAEEKKPRAPSGIASTGRSSIGTFEELAGLPDKNAEEFKLFEEVKKLVEKYAKSIGEDYTPRNALGVYFLDTQNIRIKGMNDVSVAAHEITHFLDFAYHISNQLMEVTGTTKTGNPIYSSETYKLRQELSDIYEKLYPGGKPTHKLSKRMIEGFATMLQKYAEMPSTMTSQYPNVIREFLTPEGKYYKPVMGDIIKDLRAMVAKYQGLPALDKVGARVVNDKVNVNKDSHLNFWQKFKTEVVDNVYPIEMLAKKSGTHFTKADPSLWVRQYNNSNAIILNNLKGSKGFWGWRNGEMKKLQDFNWKDLITDLNKGKITNDFGYWLVARREYFMYKELHEIEAKIENNAELIEERERAVEIKKILEHDGFTEAEVTEAYLENKQRFTDFAEQYDALVREDLNFLNDPAVGLLNADEYKQLSEQEGYASFKRYFYDEIVGEEATPMARVRFGGAKVSSMLKRTGSQKPIINPLFSALTNHAEITRKGLKQIVANRLGDVAGNFPDLFQQVELKVVPDTKGRFIYPQDKDPKIIMARIGGKRVPYLTDAVIKRTVDEVLNFQNLSLFEKLLMGSSRFFTKGTTGLFPGFAITNYTVDQVTAAAQTRNKYKPLFDPLKKVFTMLDSDNPQHQYLQEYLIMGGERQTFVGWQDMTPNELFDAIGKERAGLLKAVDYLNSGMNILALPSQWSEIMTRATEYIKSREAGKTQIVAMEEAGRVTAPFHHIGRWGGGRTGQAYIKSIPFFNPAIQVLTQAAETLETPEGRARYAFVTLAVTAASIGGLAMIMAYGSDDQKRLFADINPDELNKYIWLPNPDGKSLIKLRVPDQMAVFATLANMVWADKKLQANYSAGEYINAGMSWLPAQADISQPSKLFMAWIPQIIKPGALTLAGVKDFPKIMPLETQTVQNRAPEFRYNEQTSPVAKWLGSVIKMSPIKIDYLLTGYAGRASGFLTGKPGIYNPLKSMSREYYFTSGRKVQSFYDAKEKNDQAYEAYKKGRTDYALGERTAILKERAKLKVIESTIGLYRDVDEEKDPQKAERLRNKILKQIDEL